MCGKQRELRLAPSDGPYHGETIQLSFLPAETRRTCGSGGFPWWTLWMLWPLLAGLKWATAFAGPLLAALVQPVTLTVAPLALLLIGAGVVLLLVGRRRGVREGDDARD